MSIHLFFVVKKRSIVILLKSRNAITARHSLTQLIAKMLYEPFDLSDQKIKLGSYNVKNKVHHTKYGCNMKVEMDVKMPNYNEAKILYLGGSLKLTQPRIFLMALKLFAMKKIKIYPKHNIFFARSMNNMMKM